MISIVVCSINPGYLAQLKENIGLTINVEYEMLVWDNRVDNKGICEVYNIMASKARFEYICFLHEDIIFDTVNWGLEIHKIFSSKPEIGLIGVAGSKYKSRVLSGWYTGMKQFDCANIIHQYPDRSEHIYLKPDNCHEIADVVCLDGVFLCCKNKIWNDIKFDQNNLTGFHFYDIDFSIRASFISEVVVTYNILIKHITVGGDFGNKWVRDAFAYHFLMDKKFPISVSQNNERTDENFIIRTWLDILKKQKISFSERLKWIKHHKLLKFPRYYYAVLKFFLYRSLGLKHIHKLFARK